jgi:hypothetical protein
MATAASSVGWCNGTTHVTFPSSAKGWVPTYNGKWNCTMSRGSVGVLEGDGVYGPITAEYLSHNAWKSGSRHCSPLHS